MLKLLIDHGSSRLGNQMIRHMNALCVEDKIINIDIYSQDIECYKIGNQLKYGFPFAPLLLRGQNVPIEFAVFLAKIGIVKSIHLAALRLDTKSLVPLERARLLFDDGIQSACGYDENHIVIHVRGTDALDGTHKHYGPIPINYYKYIISETNLIPVFVGQFEGNYIGKELKSSFGNAIFHKSTNSLEDFRAIRNSKNIIISISTYSWMAAWLSNANKIFMPLIGLFNPLQRHDVAMAPLDDERFIYDLFPVRPWRGTPEQIAELKTTTNFRRLERAELASLLRRARWKSWPQRVRKHLQLLAYLALHLQGRLMR